MIPSGLKDAKHRFKISSSSFPPFSSICSTLYCVIKVGIWVKKVFYWRFKNDEAERSLNVSIWCEEIATAVRHPDLERSITVSHKWAETVSTNHPVVSPAAPSLLSHQSRAFRSWSLKLGREENAALWVIEFTGHDRRVNDVWSTAENPWHTDMRRKSHSYIPATEMDTHKNVF